MANEYKQSFESICVFWVGSVCVEAENEENAFATASGSKIGDDWPALNMLKLLFDELFELEFLDFQS